MTAATGIDRVFNTDDSPGPKDEQRMAGGLAAADFDNDGDMDWFVTSIIEQTGEEDDKYGNRLYVNDGLGTFIDATPAAGVDDGGWGWGACMEDFDNDGDLDIFRVNGWPVTGGGGEDNPNDFSVDRVRYFENRGDSTFVETAEAAGLTDRGQGRGVAYETLGSSPPYTAVRHDSPIAWGDSGGAVVDRNGDLIGVNSIISFPVSNWRAFVSILGLAIRIDPQQLTATAIMPDPEWLQEVIEQDRAKARSRRETDPDQP